MKRFTELWRAPDPEAYASLWHTEGTLLHPGMAQPIPAAEIPAYVARLVRLLPDITLTPQRWAAQGDVVFVEWTISATVAGEQVSWRGADRFTLRGSKAIEGVAYFDTLPIWARVDPTLRRTDLDRLGLPSQVEAPAT